MSSTSPDDRNLPREARRTMLASMTLGTLTGDQHGDPEIERHLLSILIAVPSAQETILDALTPECFADAANAAILRAAEELRRSRSKINAVTVAGILRKSGDYDSPGGAKQRLNELHGMTPDASFVEEYCEFLLTWARRRALLQAIQTAAVAALNPQTSPLEVIEQLGHHLDIVIRDDHSAHDDIATRADVLAAIEHNILTPESRPVIKTGFVAIDSRFGGLREQELTVVGGRPGSGKSAFGLSLAHNIGVEQGVPTIYCSYEMGRQQIWNREIGWLAKIDHSLFERDYQLDAPERDRIRQAVERLKLSALYIDSRPGPTPAQLRAFVRRVIDSYGARVVIIDQAGKLRAELKNRQRSDELSCITDALKSIAVEFDISLVVLHQLNRESEQGRMCRPSMKGLKGSGSFEEDADNIFLCYRPEYYKLNTFESGEPSEGKGDIQIEKFRNGDVGVCRLAFIARHARWENLAETLPAPQEYTPIAEHRVW